MNSNLELKAVLPNLAAAQLAARELPIHHSERQDQVDTYFGCRSGRLKLREIDLFDADDQLVESRAELIWYERPDLADAKQSNYYVIPVVAAEETKLALAAADGQLAVVRKRRWIYLVENVRIHLDQVTGLGDFLEFEAVLGPQHPLDESAQLLARLRDHFQIADDQLLQRSYGEMVLECK